MADVNEYDNILTTMKPPVIQPPTVNPDKAAEAVKLGAATGVPATAVNQDLDGFKSRVNAQAATAIVQGNPYLQDYVASNPMKAQVSSDDWANLDNYSEIASRQNTDAFWSKWIEKGDPVQKAIATIGQAITHEPEGTDDLEKILRKNLPNSTDWLASPKDLTQIASTVYKAGATAIAVPSAMFQLAVDTSAYALNRHFGIDQGKVEKELGGIGESEFGRSAVHMEHVTAMEQFHRKLAEELKGMRQDEADAKIDNIKEAFKAAQAAPTRERVPEFFKDFAEQHRGNDTIGISADIVHALYGDKIPEEGDGVLGFVPDIAQQLEVARNTGADVMVPIADLEAHASPDVFKAVEDGLRADPGTETKLEKQAEIEANKDAPPTTGDESKYPTGSAPVDHGFYDFRSAESTATTDWHAPLQKIVDDLADKFGLPITPKVWVASGPERIFGYAHPLGHIVLNESLEQNHAVATTLHELGHQVEFQRFRSLGDEDQKAVRDAWRREYGKEETIAQNRPLSNPWENTKKTRIDDISNPDYRTYLRSFPEWFAEQVQRWTTKTSEPIGMVERFFKGIADAWREIYNRVVGHVEVVPEMHDFIKGIWKGESGSPVHPYPVPTRGQIEAQPHEGIRIFTDPRAIGMTKDHWKIYEKMIEEQNRVEYETRMKKGIANEKKRMAPEWAAKQAEIRKQVVAEMQEQPLHIADQGLQSGQFKLDTKRLTDEQKAVLPRSYYGKDGMSPDLVAAYTGHTSGQALLDSLTAYHTARGKMQPMEWSRRVADKLAAERMEQVHGTFKDAVEAAVKQKVVEPTQLDAMAAELQAMAKDYGFDLPLSREQIEAAMHDKFDNSPLNMVSSDNLNEAIHRMSNKIEDRHLKEDPRQAFQIRQRKFLASILLNRALEIEAMKVKFDAQMKKFKERVIGDPGRPTVRQEYTDQIHAVMDRLGLPVKRDMADIKANMEKAGYEGLREFLTDKIADGHEIPVPWFLLDSSWKADLGSIKAGQFEQLHDFMKAMEKNGRDEQKIIIKDKEYDRDQVRQELIAGAQSIKAMTQEAMEKAFPATPPKPGLGDKIAAWGLSAVNIESICRRLDHGNFDGPWTKYVARPLIQAANARDRLIVSIAKELHEVGDFENLGQVVENKIFGLPNGKPGFMPMTRNNVIAVLANMGNKDNFTRLVEGWKVDPEEVKAWVAKNTTKDDWDKMQKVGKIFDRLFKMADNMSYELSEIGIKKLQLGVVDDPHGGGYDGWYNPIAYDKRSVRLPKGMAQDRLPLEITPTGVEGMERFHSTTRQNYTKDRTGFRGKVLLDTNIIPLRMQQMAHDITMRPAIIEANKIVNDRKIMSAVETHYGQQPADMFKPWVRDLAGASDMDPTVLSQANDLMHSFVRNIAAAQIGFNISTAAKHTTSALSNSLFQVGPLHFADAIRVGGQEGPVKGETWNDYAMRVSDELGRRSRLTPEAMMAHHGLELPGARVTATEKAGALATKIREWGTATIAYGDLASAKPTWVAEYRKAIAKDPENIGYAIELADKAVRDAHGSSALTNRPEILRNKSIYAQMTTQYYGFFNEMLQKLYEMKWRVEDTWGGDATGSRNAAENIARASNIFTRMVMLGLIEEAISGEGDPKEGWMSRAVKGTLHAFGSTLPVVRDAVQSIYSGRQPEGSMLAGGLKGMTDIVHDLSSKKAWTKPWGEQFTRHMAFFASTMPGIGLYHIFNAGHFAAGVAGGTEHPKNPLELIRGTTRGTLEHRR